VQSYSTSLHNEQTRSCREMRGQGIGRGYDSDESTVSLKDLEEYRKKILEGCQKKWNSSLSEEQQNSLLGLREVWTKQKILDEHISPCVLNDKIRNYWEYIRYRIEIGDFNDDIPVDMKKKKEEE